jgi:carbamoyl-phosphate synthase large subunit|tara:strand:+ start:1002 stop:2063 length:1062 start_codon:yes stop_codon:yes gene_type:complete
VSAPLTVFITAAGAPQSPTLIRQLKGNGERQVRVFGVDMDGEACGRFLCDGFQQIPRAGAEGYRDSLLACLERVRPDALLNVSGNDVWHVMSMRADIEAMGITVVGSDADLIELADNKFRLYGEIAEIDGDLAPRHTSPATLEEFIARAEEMGYPARDLCFKPHVSKGSRGFRILSQNVDRRDQLLNQKPTARYMSLDEFSSIFRDAPDFPKLLLMEVMQGEECDVMTIGYQGEALLTTVKSRESHRWGVIDKGELIERPELVEKTAAIIARIPLSYNLSIQFIGGKLIEINPRTSTFIYDRDFNEPWLAVKLALGLITPDEVRAYQAKIPYGRRMVRHMDQIFFNPDGQWSH